MSEERFRLSEFNTIASSNSDGLEENTAWTRVDLLAMDDADLPQPTLSGIAYPGTRHHISGEPEGLKTWLLLILTAEQMRARHAVLYIDFENGPRAMLERLRALAVPDDQIRELFHYLAPWEPIGSPGARHSLDLLLSTAEPALCVIDSMEGALALHDLDPDKGKDIEKFSRVLIDPLRSNGAATATLDHVIKSKKDRGQFAIGSQRKVGAADVHLGIETLCPFGRGRTGKAKLMVHKDRLGWLARPKLAEIELVSDSSTFQINWAIKVSENGSETAETPFRPTHQMERVSTYLESQQWPVSQNEVHGSVGGRKTVIVMALDRLVLEGYASETRGARGARLYEHELRYREQDDETA